MQRKPLGITWLLLAGLGVILTITLTWLEQPAGAAPPAPNSLVTAASPGRLIQTLTASNSAVAMEPVAAEIAVTTVPLPEIVQSQPVTLGFETGILEISSGSVFRMPIWIQTGTQPIDSADIWVDFDPDVIQVVDFHGEPANEIIVGHALPMIIGNRVDNVAGRAFLGVGRKIGDPAPFGRLHLGTIRFRALTQTVNPAGTRLTFSDASQVYYDGESLGKRREDARIIVQAPWFTGKVHLQGRGPAPSARWSDYPLQVKLLGSAGQVVYTTTITTDESGHFSLLRSPSGTFDVLIKGASSLSSLVSGVSLPFDTVLDFGALREGDATGDNRVSEHDLSLLRGAYGYQEGDAGWNARVDFNHDGKIDAADLSLLLTNYGWTGDLEPDMALSQGYPIPDARMWIDPSRPVAQQGEEIELILLLDMKSSHMDTVQVRLLFEPRHLQVIDPYGQPASQVVPTENFSIILKNRVCNASGEVLLTAGRAPAELALGGQLIVMKLRMRALANTTNGLQGTPLTFDPSSEAFFKGEPILRNRSDGAVIIALGTRSFEP